MLDSEANPMSKQSADNYVKSVMANNIVVPVEVHSERPVSNFNSSNMITPRKVAKRKISGDNDKTNSKKQRNSPGVLREKIRHAPVISNTTTKRNVSNSSDHDRIEVISSQSDNNDLNELKGMVRKLTETMNNMRDHLSERIDCLEHNFTKTIEKVVDRKIEAAMKKERSIVQKDIKKLENTINTDIDQLKGDFKRDLDDIKKDVSSLKDSGRQKVDRSETVVDNDKRNNAVIQNLPESENENLLSKVSGLLKDGLRVRNIGIHSVERKKSNREGKPGIVIVKFKDSQDKRKVMELKKNLRESRNFREVFIENDLPKTERILNANLRRIVNTIGRDKLEIRGSRIQTRRFDSETTENRESMNRRSSERSHYRSEKYEDNPPRNSHTGDSRRSTNFNRHNSYNRYNSRYNRR